MRMGYFELSFLMIFTLISTSYHAFEVSIETHNHIPVIGRDNTLVCTFIPPSWKRWVRWEKGDDGSSSWLASRWCTNSSNSCRGRVPDPTKYKLIGDRGSVNLTVKEMNANDGDIYKCIVGTSIWSAKHSSATLELSAPLTPAPPQFLAIRVDGSTGYTSDARITVTAGKQYDITCESGGARPPAVLDWVLPDNMIVSVGEQSDDVQEGSYISRKGAKITPSSNDQGRSIRCEASHPKLTNTYRRSLYLAVQVPPSDIFLSGNHNSNGSSTTFYVYENVPAPFTCKSIGSLPAVELTWALGPTYRIPGNTSISVPNILDGHLFDSESNLTIFIEMKHHETVIQCFASSEVFLEIRAALLWVFGEVFTPD